MTVLLNPPEVRVLGALIEKRWTTPDSYPLTLNALVAACNQASNRDPVTQYDAHQVNEALISTRTQGLSALVSRSGARAHKFSEQLSDALGLQRAESALLAELMLRGPQTPGELRQRASRMADLEALSDVERWLHALMTRAEPLVTMLPRQAGKREARYAHLLGGPVRDEEPHPGALPGPPTEPSLHQRVARLEAQMAELLARLDG